MDYSILVNKNNRLTRNYIKGEQLVPVVNVEGKEVFLERRTFSNYQDLEKFLKNKGLEIGIIGGYRSLEEQKEMYKRICNSYGRDYADRVVAPAGMSEHHTGLSIDLSIRINGSFVVKNSDLIANEKEYRRIHKYLSEFGFVLRYPEEKEDVTGYPYEPWHIRYVGRDLARILFDDNLTLEEYKGL
jgi:zinc D-Ala-D-Ala carboxypeptidase